MYRVNEIFLSCQGEGPDIGHTVVFVRFAGCNLMCEFCDTDHEQFELMSLDELVKKVTGFGQRRVVLTGGEPLLQLDLPLVRALARNWHRLSLETNGERDVGPSCPGFPVDLLDYFSTGQIVVSPKTNNFSPVVIGMASAIKILWPLPPGLEWSAVQEMVHLTQKNTEHPDLILQPVTPKRSMTKAGVKSFREHCRGAVDKAIELNRAGGRWRVIPQTHVWMGVR